MATQQCTGFNRFNGWMLREEVKREEVKSEEVRGEKEDFFHSPTLRLSDSSPLPTQNSTKTAGVPHSNGTPLSVGRNAREAYPLNKLSINATEFLQYVIHSCHETSPDSILQTPSNA